MRSFLYTILVISVVTGCSKRPEMRTYSCRTPQIVLQQQGFDQAEWDTIITTVYEPGFLYPIASDTFVTTDITNELLITPDINSPKDFAIFLPSVNKIFLVHDISFINRYQNAPEGQKADCYHDINFSIGDELVTGLNTATGHVYARLRK